MRRLLAVLLAAASSTAGAQTTTPLDGEILFEGVKPGTVNRAACAAGAATSIGLTWDVTLDPNPGILSEGRFLIYAQATAPTSNYCTPAADPANLLGTVSAPTSEAVLTPVDVTMDTILTATGFTCDAGSKTVYVCVHFVDASSTNKGYARGTIDLKLVAPNAPTVTKVTIGEEALSVEIDPATSGEAAVAFVAKAVAVDSVSFPGEERSARTSLDGRARIEGLVNGRDYYVTAFTYSADENESPESFKYGAAADGSGGTPVAPQPIQDAWEHYDALGGRDSGGCQAGGAGLAALACAAVLLRLRRRS
jgi:hypothetical protein